MEEMDSSSSNSSHMPSSNETESDTGLAMRTLPNLMTVLRCHDDARGPHLVILEEPQVSFRFRYKSEMGGTHGCLLGRNSKSKNKTHPSVELIGYKGRAVIKCHLAQFDRNDEHPHKLGVIDEDNPEPLEISQIVGPNDFALGFPNMGIIYTGKKQVPKVLFNRFIRTEMLQNLEDNKKLLQYCESLAKNINLNKVRLKFSAHHVDTDQELCAPVFSDIINNLKSAETNELKICRIDRNTGSVKGNEEIFILVEKVNKKNIKVRFVEVAEGDEDGEPVWSSEASFTQNDVHHQFAIVFKTPPYRNLEVTKDVPVFIELYRPKDGRRSERTPFTYKASPRFVQSKKRKANPSMSSYSSLDGSSGGSLHSSDMPIVLNHMNNLNALNQTIITGIDVPEPLPVAPAAASTTDQNYMQTLVPPSGGNVGLADALYLRDHRDVPTMAPALHPGVPQAPAATYSGSYSMHLSSDFNLNDINLTDLLREGGLQNSGEFRRVVENLESDPFREYWQHMTKMKEEDYESTASVLDFRMNPAALRNDAATQIKNDGKMRGGWRMEDAPRFQSGSCQYVVKKEPYVATYTRKDGEQVQHDSNEPLADSDIFDKRVSQEIDCHVGLFLNLIKNKDRHSPGYLKMKIAETLENLMEHRMSNGDTFAHMLVMTRKLAMLEYIVKQLQDTGLLSQLNSQNNHGETVLHLAIKEDLNKHIKFLVEKGCDPMLEDVEGNNAVHVAALHSDKDLECLKQLLDAISESNFKQYTTYSLDKLNNAKETPLHLAAKYGHADSFKLLVEAGANLWRRNGSGKLPLHLTVSGDHLSTLQHIIPRMTKTDVDELDGNNNTALQIVCSGTQRRHSLAIAQLLCDKGANILKSSGGNSCPLKLASEDPQMLSLLRKYLAEDTVEVKSEPEDEFESAEEDSSDEESWEDFALLKSDKPPGGQLPEQVRQADGASAQTKPSLD